MHIHFLSYYLQFSVRGGLCVYMVTKHPFCLVTVVFSVKSVRNVFLLVCDWWNWCCLAQQY